MLYDVTSDARKVTMDLTIFIILAPLFDGIGNRAFWRKALEKIPSSTMKRGIALVDSLDDGARTLFNAQFGQIETADHVDLEDRVDMMSLIGGFVSFQLHAEVLWSLACSSVNANMQLPECDRLSKDELISQIK